MLSAACQACMQLKAGGLCLEGRKWIVHVHVQLVCRFVGSKQHD